MQVFTTTNDYAYFYAESTDGRTTFAGHDGPWVVYDRRFNECLHAARTAGARLVGWNRIPTSGSRYDLELA